MLVEKTNRNRLHASLQKNACKLFKETDTTFTEKEQRGKSVFGKGSNIETDTPCKEALEPVRVDAIIAMYTGELKVIFVP